jgi:protein-disulfide isomerase
LFGKKQINMGDTGSTVNTAATPDPTLRDHHMGRRPARASTCAPLLILSLLVVCDRPSTRAELARLAARVDSLAVVIMQMQATVAGREPRGRPDTTTVAAAGAAALGSESAPITVVEFTDYQCPFCAQHAQETLAGLIKEFVDQGTVRYVVRDMPLNIHRMAEPAARAARCAGAQGSDRYWRYHDALFETQTRLADSTLVVIARDLQLDLPRFEACLKRPDVAAMVQRDAAEAAGAGLTVTPSFVIGKTAAGKVKGAVVSGALPLDHFRSVIRKALAATTPVASIAP